MFKTAGRIEPAIPAAAAGGGNSGGGSAAPEGAPALAASAASAEMDEDITFGVFVPAKWTYDMVKKDMMGDGLDGSRSVGPSIGGALLFCACDRPMSACACVRACVRACAGISGDTARACLTVLFFLL